MTRFVVEVMFENDGRCRVDHPYLMLSPNDEVVWVSSSSERFHVVMWEAPMDPPDIGHGVSGMLANAETGIPVDGQTMALASRSVALQVVQWRVPGRYVDIHYAVQVDPAQPSVPGATVGMIRIERLATTGAGGGVSPPRPRGQQQ